MDCDEFSSLSNKSIIPWKKNKIISHNLSEKKGCLKASMQLMRRLGSISRHRRIRSINSGSPANTSSTVFNPIIFSICSILSWFMYPSLNSFRRSVSWHFCIIQLGYFPLFFSIMARCSSSEWVGKNNSPVKSSQMMHPIDQTSLISSHLQHWRIT